jgi:hypothetical protein
MLSRIGDWPQALFDTKDSSIIISSMAGAFDPNDRNYHEATPDEWSRLLHAQPQPPLDTVPPSTGGS